MTRMESLMSVSALFDSLSLNWEDNSGCASRLTSINIQLWPDGVLPLKRQKGFTLQHDQSRESLKPEAANEPISYVIPRICLKQVPRDGNLFSLTLSSNHSSCPHVLWNSLDKCRKYVLEMESQYSSSWTGPSSSQTIFTSIAQGTFFFTTFCSIIIIFNNTIYVDVYFEYLISLTY